MPDFDPSAYLAQKTAAAAPPAFDPARYLAEKTAPVAAKPEGIDVGGIADSAMRGVAQGSTFGFADEGAAALGGLKDYIAGKLGLRGDVSLPDAYHTYRDAIRNADAAAEAAHPRVYLGGELGGGLAGAFVPGLDLLAPSKGAGLIEAVGKGAAMGALGGAGNAQEITDVPGAMARGAGTGAAVGGAVNVGGKVLSAVGDAVTPARIGSVLLNAPESALQRYIDNPAAVNAARPRAELVQDEFLPRLQQLQNEVTGGSAASRATLAAEGQTVPGSAIADILDAKKAQLLTRSEGVMDDPRFMAAVKWLDETADKYRPEVVPAPVNPDGSPMVISGPDGNPMAVPPHVIEKQLSTNRIKDLLQNLDNQTEYEVSPGRFSRVADSVRQDVRSQVDSLLKGNSPAYTAQMKDVAADAALLDDVSGLAKTPQTFDNLLKRTQRGSTPQLMSTLQAFDTRTGGGLLEELENSAVKDALARGAINGSRNVNLYRNFSESVGDALGGPLGRLAGKGIGALGGATVDKYGPAMARDFIDHAAAAQAAIDASPAAQAAITYGQPALEAIQAGNPTAAILAPMLEQKRNAIQRRIGQ